MIELKKSDWIAVIISIVIFQILSLWCIDVSTSAMMIERYGIQNGVEEMPPALLTNGFFQQNPVITYHISLFWLVISSFLIALISIHHIDKGGEKLSNKKHLS